MNWDAGGLFAGLTGWEAAARATAGARSREAAARMEGEVRARHPWRDRTGEAARSIAGRAMDGGDEWTIELFCGAPYAAFLERGGYAVLGPTVRRGANELAAAMRITEGMK